jgi:outer membrane protein assembly factor BamB
MILTTSHAASWSTYRGDATRSGHTAEALPAKLSLAWEHQADHAPQPAWPRSRRMQFDRAAHTVAADGSIYFGSSVDGTVRALDAKSGKPRWTFYTDAPVRFAPAIWKDRLFVASDDGFLYALSLADGKLIWKKRGGPSNAMVLGNQRMISKWPARGGPLVVGDAVYFAAGIWPSEGIFLYALEAATGKVRWVNDSSGGIYMAQPHGGAKAKSGVSAQGYLVASAGKLFVPTGRAVPAAFDLKTGKFLYFHLQKYGHNGGEPTMAVGDMFFNSGLSFDASSGARVAKVGAGPLAGTSDGLVQASGKTLTAYQWVDTVKRDRKGKPITTRSLKKLWSATLPFACTSLISAGEQVIAGGLSHVAIVDAKTQKVSWSEKVTGTVYGLSVSDGKLLVSTDRGGILCFDAIARPEDSSESSFLAVDPRDGLYPTMAKKIIEETGITAGYCLDFGCGDGSLSLELARRTKLRIIAVDADPKQVALARKRLTAAGVYGSQVTVHHRDLSATGYPRYFANLIVSGRSVTVGGDSVNVKTVERFQRPYGGTVCVGKPSDMKKVVLLDLRGAGSWTHQYGDAANSLCSDDDLIKGTLGMLWFRDVDFDIPQRHGRAPAPLSHRGRLIHAGLNGLCAVDAYNGHVLWRYEIKGLLAAYNGDELMGTAGTGSNFCLHDDSVFVRDGGRCLHIDAATGKLLREIPTPAGPDGKPGIWGHISAVDGTLFGTVDNPKHVVTYRYVNRGGDMKRLLTESYSLFAIDTKTGKLKWHYKATDSIRHNAIAVAGEKVFIIDRPLALFDQQKKPKDRKHPTGKLIALDAATGKKLWEKTTDIYGTTLAASEKHGAVLMSYQPTRFRLASEVGGRMTAFGSAEGDKMWEIKADYQSRPLINNYTIYTQGGAWDLLSGKPRPFNFKRSYGCGVLAGSKNMMFFRSATLGYFDLAKNKTTENYGGVRPGCWINAIPAGGLVLVPDASAGCQCSYLNRTWFALEPLGK